MKKRKAFALPAADLFFLLKHFYDFDFTMLLVCVGVIVIVDDVCHPLYSTAALSIEPPTSTSVLVRLGFDAWMLT